MGYSKMKHLWDDLKGQMGWNKKIGDNTATHNNQSDKSDKLDKSYDQYTNQELARATNIWIGSCKQDINGESSDNEIPCRVARRLFGSLLEMAYSTEDASNTAECTRYKNIRSELNEGIEKDLPRYV